MGVTEETMAPTMENGNDPPYALGTSSHLLGWHTQGHYEGSQCHILNGAL
jgi:hypothetical protein